MPTLCVTVVIAHLDVLLLPLTTTLLLMPLFAHHLDIQLSLILYEAPVRLRCVISYICDGPGTTALTLVGKALGHWGTLGRAVPRLPSALHLTAVALHMLQAHYAEFTGRDAAMSKSLNSDYLSQLYIRADTKSMDKELARPGVASSGLPEEAQALVVFKRG